MKVLYSKTTNIILLSLLVLFTPALQAAVAVITNLENQEIGLSKNQIAKIYLGKMKHYSNGEKIKAVNLSKTSKTYKKFNKAIIKKSDAALNRYWSKLKFTGKGKPPKTLASEREVIQWVANTEGAIGYVDGKYLNKSVNVVLILP